MDRDAFDSSVARYTCIAITNCLSWGREVYRVSYPIPIPSAVLNITSPCPPSHHTPSTMGHHSPPSSRP